MISFSKYAYWLINRKGFRCSRCLNTFKKLENEEICPFCGAEMINGRKKDKYEQNS